MYLKRRVYTKATAGVTPKIGVVFHLVAFLMLTQSILATEPRVDSAYPVGNASTNLSRMLELSATAGRVDISVPIVGPANERGFEFVQVIQVRLEASANGTMSALSINSRDLGNGPEAFAKLNLEIRQIIGRPATPWDYVVELDPDHNLNFRFLVSAIEACSRKVQINPCTQQKQVVRYVEQFQFASPRKPQV